MVDNNQNILNAIDEARILGIFKKFCETNSSSDSKLKLRNIYASSNDKITTTIKLIGHEQNLNLSYDTASRLYELITAFLKKSNFRKPLSNDEKIELLSKQKRKCAICGCDLQSTYHADHIVPFKYVGDELENNWQLLCSYCNERKSDSIDYQIKYLLNLI